MKKLFTLLFVVFAASFAQAQCMDLFFSEYIEGSSNNKALEIYNPTSGPVNLSNYVVYRYNNGSTTATDSLFPQGTLAAGDVYVIANSSADSLILAQGDTTSTLTFYNGDDAISLINQGNGDTLDIIGEIGVDPGSAWTVGTGETREYTLVRMPTQQEGETVWTSSVNQWLVFPQNTFDSLGTHSMNPCGGGGQVTLNFNGVGTTVNEGAGSATVEVSVMSPDPNNATSVDITVGAASTATQGTDFTFTPNTLTFPANSAGPLSITITITDDAIIEGNEEIVFELTNPTNNAVIGNGSYALTIEDNDIPTYTISQVTGVDTDGVADSVGLVCRLTGLVYGVNLRPGGLQFALIDPTDGIQVFSFAPVSGYTVTEGDSIAVTGEIVQFNGLLQIEPDSVEFFSAGNTLKNPTLVTTLDETTESDFISINNLTLVDVNQWTGTGSGFNVDVTNGVDTFQMRIDNDVDLYSMTAPTISPFMVCGIGGQFDSSSPYTEGYQIFPRYSQDIKPVLSRNSQTLNGQVQVYPNPNEGNFQVELNDANGQYLDLELVDLNGRTVLAQSFGQFQNRFATLVNAQQLTAGIYLLRLRTDEGVALRKLVIE